MRKAKFEDASLQEIIDGLDAGGCGRVKASRRFPTAVLEPRKTANSRGSEQLSPETAKFQGSAARSLCTPQVLSLFALPTTVSRSPTSGHFPVQTRLDMAVLDSENAGFPNRGVQIKTDCGWKPQ